MEKVIDQKRIDIVNHAYLFGMLWRNEHLGTEYIINDGKIKGIVQGNRTILCKE
jgi:hypothetical protein